MQPEAPALIWDARRATDRVVEFVSGRSWDDYRQDVMLRSAVERQFQIIGEALKSAQQGRSRHRRSGPGPRPHRRLPQRPVHGYAQIDDALVWEVASTRVPELTAVLAGLLDGT